MKPARMVKAVRVRASGRGLATTAGKADVASQSEDEEMQLLS